MHRSFATTAALLFPPARRLYAAVQSLNASVSALAGEQARLREQQDNLARELARVSPHQPKGTLAGPATDGAPLFVPPGHFYSPIVDLGELRAGGFQIRNSVQEFTIDCDMPIIPAGARPPLALRLYELRRPSNLLRWAARCLLTRGQRQAIYRLYRHAAYRVRASLSSVAHSISWCRSAAISAVPPTGSLTDSLRGRRGLVPSAVPPSACVRWFDASR
jgi:hypothetical protein